MFIDEFIPTIDTEKGICYTHPKDLPGAKKDGSSIHFFHKTTNAYASGRRKRRKIESDKMGETVRWHKTGKTKPVVENGIHKGCKKIMVLYKGSKKGAKPERSHWVMHQYHLGTIEDENEGEYVVSKIIHQPPKQSEDTGAAVAEEESLPLVSISAGPETPNPCPPKPGNSFPSYDANVEDLPLSAMEDPAVFWEGYHTPSNAQPNEELAPLAGESQAVNFDTDVVDDSLLCKEIFSSCAPLDGGFPSSLDDITAGRYCDGFNDLVNLELDTSPDFQLADLQFSSQDSIFDLLDRL
uniref:NAC domain-containing protein n=1 Tax=Tamarix hispida TaxID=189793 RepID=I6YLU2_9CARY|nr:NAC domain-containing protein [Tamarix hispida]